MKMRINRFRRNDIGGIFNNTIVQVVLIIWVISEMLPMAWILLSSFKTTEEITYTPFSLPKSFNFDNYNFELFSEKEILVGAYYKNSLIVVVISLVILLLVSLLAGYAIAKLKVPGKNILLIILVGMIAVPTHALIIPLYYFFAEVKLLSNYFGVILPLVTINAPFSIILLQAYFKGFPDELIESAKIDGCGNMRVFFSIVLPVAIGSISAVIVINFMRIWNDFLLSLVMLKANTSRTLPVGLMAFKEIYQVQYGPMFAVIVLSLIPTIIIFIIFSRYMIRGLTAGAIKG